MKINNSPVEKAFPVSHAVPVWEEKTNCDCGYQQYILYYSEEENKGFVNYYDESCNSEWPVCQAIFHAENLVDAREKMDIFIAGPCRYCGHNLDDDGRCPNVNCC